MADFDFELENINTSNLVTFLPVRDCFTADHRIRVQWNLGDDFNPDVWDYVGLYHTGWESVNDYLAYKWAPTMPRHPFCIRRRCVHFMDVDFDHVRMPEVDYQFLYVANGDYVVGISNPFQFPRSAGYDDDLCFDILESLSQPKPYYPPPTESRKRLPSENVVNLVREYQLCSPSKRRVVKQKILTVYKDHDSLTSDFTDVSTWKDSLKIVNNIVKEYDPANELSVVPYIPVFPTESTKDGFQPNAAQVAVTKKEEQPEKKLIYDIRNQDRITKKEQEQPHSSSCVEFPIRLPLLPGPQCIAERLLSGVQSCTFCNLSRVIISELVRREQVNEKTIKNLKQELQTTKVQTVVVERRHKKKHQPRSFAGSKEELFYKKKIGDLLRKNSGLLKQARYWKKKCLISRSELQNSQFPEQSEKSEVCQNDQDEESQNTEYPIKEALQELQHQETADSGCSTMSSDNPNIPDEENGWKTQKPKRIARLQQVISQQSQTIQTVGKTVSNQRETISRQANEISQLRKAVLEQEMDKKNAEAKLSEMTDRVKSILRGRYKEKSVEWRQFARKISNESFQGINPSGAAASVNLGNDLSSKHERPFIKARTGTVSPYCVASQRISVKLERKCPTCNMVFSKHVDPHVIEEHIVFHQVYNKKIHAD